jgi:hypothetical protein
LVVGEVEGRTQAQPVDVLSTSFATCFEVKDGEAAIAQGDAHMPKVAACIRNLCQGALLDDLPTVRCPRPDQPREINLSPCTDWFSGGFPIMKNIALTWTVAQGPQGAWFIIASHRRSLDDAVNALSRDIPEDERFVGCFDSCGSGNGRRIERHLRSWCGSADKFAEVGHADDFRKSVEAIADLAGGLQNCRWQLERPAQDRMRLEIQIELAPPESTRAPN